MQTFWWVLGAGLLLLGIRAEGMKEALWALTGAGLFALAAIAAFLVLSSPTGLIVTATMALAAGTWRFMWWLTERGYI